MENELNKLRKEINLVDENIVKFLEMRFYLAEEIGNYKKINNLPVLDENREKKVIENCKKHLKNNEYSKYLEKIFIQIMEICKDIQNDY